MKSKISHCFQFHKIHRTRQSTAIYVIGIVNNHASYRSHLRRYRNYSSTFCPVTYQINSWHIIEQETFFLNQQESLLDKADHFPCNSTKVYLYFSTAKVQKYINGSGTLSQDHSYNAMKAFYNAFESQIQGHFLNDMNNGSIFKMITSDRLIWRTGELCILKQNFPLSASLATVWSKKAQEALCSKPQAFRNRLGSLCSSLHFGSPLPDVLQTDIC